MTSWRKFAVVVSLTRSLSAPRRECHRSSMGRPRTRPGRERFVQKGRAPQMAIRPAIPIHQRALGQPAGAESGLVAGRAQEQQEVSRESAVVMELTSGWKLIRSCSIRLASRIIVTGAGPVVGERKRRHGAGLDPQDLAQLLGRAERQPARGADRRMDALQIDLGLVLATMRNRRPFLSLTKRFLEWAPGNAGLTGAIGDGEDRLVLERRRPRCRARQGRPESSWGKGGHVTELHG